MNAIFEEEAQEKFLTPLSFLTIIEGKVKESEVNHIQAIIEFCEENDLTFVDVLPLVGPSLKDRIEVDAIEAGYFPAKAQLPI